MERLNSKMEMTEVFRKENISTATIQSEQQIEKQTLNEHSLSYMWERIKSSNIGVIRLLEEIKEIG